MINQLSTKPTHDNMLTINNGSSGIKFAVFDPNRHEAVSVRNDPSQPDQIILEFVQHGYCLGDKVFRPAKVIVNDLSYFPGGRHAR